MSQYIFIEPHDVLILRGNKLFGAAGSYGESQVLPWPSVVAGAIRSALLAESGHDFEAFAAGTAEHPQLGTPQQPGAFRLLALGLARHRAEGVEMLRPLPADLFVPKGKGEQKLHEIQRLQPTPLAPGMAGSAKLPRVAALQRDATTKPEQGIWLTEAGWNDHLDGKLPASQTLVASKALWKIDERIGVGLNAATGAAHDSALFTTQAVAFRDNVGLLAAIDGIDTLPATGTLRLGGDGRAARYQSIERNNPLPDLAAIAQARCCRLILTTPGLFEHGWLPPGITMGTDGYHFDLHGVRARLICAAVARAEVISGWDLAARQPKPAQRAAPIGSVYWLKDLDADEAALRKLATECLWPEQGYDAVRRAEGFNRCAIAAWKQGTEA